MKTSDVQALLLFLAVLAVMILPQVAGFKVTDVLGNPEPLPQQVQEAANYAPAGIAIAAVVVIIVIGVAFFGKLFGEPAGS